MKYYIGADLGTSALKLLLCDEKKRIVKTVTREYPVSYPRSGWSEQAPELWWNAFAGGLGELVGGIDAFDVAALAVAGQMHGLVALDENDKVIRPAILWNDGRTENQTEYLNKTVGKDVLSQYTANIAFAGFTAPKLLWMRENEPENFERIKKIMLPKDYITYRLTGAFVTDYSDASGMLLLDVKNKRWSDRMLDICHISEDMLPKLCESFEAVGTVKKEIAQTFGFCEGVKVAAGAGDNAAAAVGMAAVGGGKCNISLGTSGTIFITDEKFGVDENNALHSFCHADGGYHLMGCILSAASCNKWFCDEILCENDYSSLQNDVPQELLGENNVFFLPYLMGERSPINDTDATGVFIGMRPDTTRKEMLLAVLEGVAFAIRDNLEIAGKLGINIIESTVCGGGARSPLWMKILANVLDIKLLIPSVEEGPGYGGAILAAVCSGEYADITDACNDILNIKETVIPDAVLSQKYEKKYNKYKKIYPAVKELYKDLKGE